jgi:hypothetical protein
MTDSAWAERGCSSCRAALAAPHKLKRLRDLRARPALQSLRMQICPLRVRSRACCTGRGVAYARTRTSSLPVVPHIIIDDCRLTACSGRRVRFWLPNAELKHEMLSHCSEWPAACEQPRGCVWLGVAEPGACVGAPARLEAHAGLCHAAAPPRAVARRPRGLHAACLRGWHASAQCKC